MNSQLNKRNPYEDAQRVLETTFRLPEVNNENDIQKLEPFTYLLSETDSVIKAASELITREAKTDKGRANEMFKNLQHYLASTCLATEACIFFGNGGNDKKKQRIISFLQQSNNTAKKIYEHALTCHSWILDGKNLGIPSYYIVYLDRLEKFYNKLKKDLDFQTSTGFCRGMNRLSNAVLGFIQNHLPKLVAPIAMAPDPNQAFARGKLYETGDYQDQNQGFDYQLDEELAGKWEYKVNLDDINKILEPLYKEMAEAKARGEDLKKYENDIRQPEYLGEGGFGVTYRLLLPNGEFCVAKLFGTPNAFIHEFTVNMVLKAQAMNIINSFRAGDHSEQNIFLCECLYHLVACYSNLQIPLTTTPEKMKDFLERNTDKFELTIKDKDRYVHGYALIFECVEGTTLLNAVQSNPTMSFEVLQTSINLLGQLCRALAFLDYAGIIHMDFKNDNMMITNQKTIKLLDLGIAFLRTNMTLFENPLLEYTFYSMTPEMLAAIAEATRARDEAKALAGVRDEEEEIKINLEIFQVMENNFDKINIFPLWRVAFSILFWQDGFDVVDQYIFCEMERNHWDINTAVALDEEFRSNIEQNLNKLNTKPHITLDGKLPFFHIKQDHIFDLDTINSLLELLTSISMNNPEERMSAVDAFAFIQDEILPNMIPYQIPEENKEEEEAKDAA